MGSMVDELRDAMRQGAALAAAGSVVAVAGCGGRSERIVDEATGGELPSGGSGSSTGGASRGGSSRGGSGGSVQTGGSGGSTVDPNDAGPALEPYPLDELGCFGPEHDGGYYGRCCVEAHCFSPLEGDCPAADDVSENELPSFPPGTGSCECRPDVGVRETRGAFAPNPSHTPVTTGSCCYLVGSIECEGRPLVIAGRALLAPLVVRDDWFRRST